MIRTFICAPVALALGFAPMTVGAQTPGCTYDHCALRLISGPGSTGVVQGAEATPVGFGTAAPRLLGAAVAFFTIKGKARDGVAGGFLVIAYAASHSSVYGDAEAGTRLEQAIWFYNRALPANP